MKNVKNTSLNITENSSVKNPADKNLTIKQLSEKMKNINLDKEKKTSSLQLNDTNKKRLIRCAAKFSNNN
jgi:hypothetical protein